MSRIKQTERGEKSWKRVLKWIKARRNVQDRLNKRDNSKTSTNPSWIPSQEDGPRKEEGRCESVKF